MADWVTMESMILLILIAAVLVLPSLMIQRRQKRRLDEIRRVQENVTPGDVVITTAGLHATVQAVAETTVELESSPGVVSTYEKFAIVQNLSAEQAAAAETAPEATDEVPNN